MIIMIPLILLVCVPLIATGSTAGDEAKPSRQEQRTVGGGQSSTSERVGGALFVFPRVEVESGARPPKPPGDPDPPVRPSPPTAPAERGQPLPDRR